MLQNSTNETKKALLQAHQLLVKNKDPESAANFLSGFLSDNTDIQDPSILFWLALCYLESAQYDLAKGVYLKMESFYQAGFCELLKGNLHEAKEIWRHCANSEVKNWSRSLENILEGFIFYEPTFLGLRNHLEVDVSYLLRAGQIKFAENINIGGYDNENY